ncbi:uncharacterized protein APUU_12077S [Aspergillus puulaauensis]|uniref:Uncharacterized protein n=1 Tax=Aspergillus puulaauensis TaxID=1220207 RepID=A0A7R7XDC4_9EURO|nr:uncharacterized protein APUU_12077S [Aspergillus puulaauensis]BCS19249.1 hypothetical protein APUU_12077S [Aspergillus puulaauensis]
MRGVSASQRGSEGGERSTGREKWRQVKHSSPSAVATTVNNRSCELVMGLAVCRNRNFAADLRTTTQQVCFSIPKRPGRGVWSVHCLSSFVSLSGLVTARPLPPSGELEATKNLHL